ncbi:MULTISPECIES: MbtH family NRPS accessory protein [unclassified Burkholderia]|uniref:MbtH family NRPS accessory protein n=1 Tax=unclassified Burkholderia TaxID=2613784 RepID=UPI000F5859EF|nr:MULTISPECIES: MbtH family NRPS accessory protein [unclassified Burkholderia]RQR70576.1 MbtH family protein [Burkholderia sp. Bp9012]RQR77853.1 MbtH family protein [Burkholderia sp. Bp9011]RQR87849.1 MbtH family protein [Burkholderia sp. Bp9010]RQZ43789.1 MbtH family protein [Burkholderia sp. Bp9099]
MDDREQFRVVVNAAGEHSIWSIRHPLPEGWVTTGFEGGQAICCQYIASLRARLGGAVPWSTSWYEG